MNDYDGYLNVGQMIEEGRIDKRRLIAAGNSGELPIAVWADGFFITEYPLQHPAKYRLSSGEWLWLRTAYLRNFEGRKEIRMVVSSRRPPFAPVSSRPPRRTSTLT